jgi:hypothetical protein
MMLFSGPKTTDLLKTKDSAPGPNQNTNPFPLGRQLAVGDPQVRGRGLLPFRAKPRADSRKDLSLRNKARELLKTKGRPRKQSENKAKKHWHSGQDPEGNLKSEATDLLDNKGSAPDGIRNEATAGSKKVAVRDQPSALSKKDQSLCR